MSNCLAINPRSDLSPELDPPMLREKLSYHAACCANTAGGYASLKYLTFAKGLLTEEECDNVWKSLSEYCKHDTYAMVKLIEFLMTKI